MKPTSVLLWALGLPLISLVGCQTPPPDPDRDYEPPSGAGISKNAYKILRPLRGRVLIWSQGKYPTGCLRIVGVHRASRSPLVENGSRDDVIVTFRRTNLLGGTRGIEQPGLTSYATLRNNFDAGHLHFRATGKWHDRLPKGKVSPEYESFWTKPKKKSVGVKPSDIHR